jgi:hypothetical protein
MHVFPDILGDKTRDVMAEADGNRTRRTGFARSNCVEDSEAHQVLVRPRHEGTVLAWNALLLACLTDSS